VSTGSGYLPHAIARFAESNPFSLEAAPGRSVHVGLRQTNFFQKQKKLKTKPKKKVSREKSKKSDSETYWQVVRWGGGERHEREGCGSQIKYTSIFLPSNLVVLEGTFFVKYVYFLFSFLFGFSLPIGMRLHIGLGS
jgi:hypothetical protein